MNESYINSITSVVILTLGLGLLAGMINNCCGMDYIESVQDGRSISITGEVLVEAQDGGLLVRDQRDVYYAVEPDQLKNRRSDETPFACFNIDQMKAATLADLPEGFAVHQTANYLIFYNTSKTFAVWTGGLFERLHDVFYNYWKNQGVELAESPLPMVAVLLANKQEYINFADDELGDAAENIIGYYSMQTNRIVTYDMTGMDQQMRRSSSYNTTNASKINAMLSRPGAIQLVATVVHEATHQLCYNSGMLIRLADTPRWLSEGLAVNFEMPDLQSSRGWRTIGKPNQMRLVRFKKRLSHRNPSALYQLLTKDSLFNETETGLDAYAEAWALTWFLTHRYPKQFALYAKIMGGKTPFVWDDASTRIEQFEKHFGPWNQIDKELEKYFQRF